MSKKRFTEEETAAFRANPAVASVSLLSIRFTEAFRQEAYIAFQEGKSVIDIFEDAGLDIRVLGLPRVSAFRRKLQERAEQEAGASGDPVRRPAKTDSEKVELRNSGAVLENEVSPITRGISKNSQESLNIRKEGVCFA